MHELPSFITPQARPSPNHLRHGEDVGNDVAGGGPGHVQKQVEGSGGEAGAGERADHDVPGEDVAGGHVGEDGEGVREGAAEAGVGGDELGGEENVGVEAGAKEEGVEPAERGVGEGGVEEGVDGGGGGGG